MSSLAAAMRSIGTLVAHDDLVKLRQHVVVFYHRNSTVLVKRELDQADVAVTVEKLLRKGVTVQAILDMSDSLLLEQVK